MQTKTIAVNPSAAEPAEDLDRFKKIAQKIEDVSSQMAYYKAERQANITIYFGLSDSFFSEIQRHLESNQTADLKELACKVANSVLQTLWNIHAPEGIKSFKMAVDILEKYRLDSTPEARKVPDQTKSGILSGILRATGLTADQKAECIAVAKAMLTEEYLKAATNNPYDAFARSEAQTILNAISQ